MINLVKRKYEPPQLSSKKREEKLNSKEKIQKLNYLKIPLTFYLDPIPCHRIYRDYMIPDYTFSSGNLIYLFEEYLHYKTLCNVHIRENGLVFQFADNDPEFITPLGLLKSRLNSLGNASAHDMAEFLPLYYSYFQAIENDLAYQKDEPGQNQAQPKLKTNEPVLADSSTNAKLLKIIDDLFSENEGMIQFVSVSQMLKGYDDRAMMFCYSKELHGLIQINEGFDDNVFESDIIDKYLQMLFCYNYETRMKEMIHFLSILALNREVDRKSTYMRDMNTIFGHIKAEFSLKTINVEIDGIKFVVISSILLNNEKNEWLLSLMQNKQNYLNIRKAGIENECEKHQEANLKNDWEKLMKFYFPKILKKNEKKTHMN